MTERTSYLAIRDSFLDIGFQYCANKFQNGAILPWKEGESEWIYAANVLAKRYEMPIEKMMLAVIAVIANAGRAKQFHIENINYINFFLKENNINKIINKLNQTPNKDEETEKEIFSLDFKYIINNQTLLTDEHRTEFIRKELEYCFEEAKKNEKEEKLDEFLQEKYDDVNRYRIIQRFFKKNHK